MHKLFANFVFNIDFIKMSVYAKRETIRKAVILHDDEYYRSRIPEPDLGALKNFMRFVWNPDRRTLLGRSGKEWGNCFKISQYTNCGLHSYLILHVQIC